MIESRSYGVSINLLRLLCTVLKCFLHRSAYRIILLLADESFRRIVSLKLIINYYRSSYFIENHLNFYLMCHAFDTIYNNVREET